MMATALVLAVAGNAGAAPTVPSPFFGVIADGPLLLDPNVSFSGQTETMVASGVQTMRVAFYWSGAQPYRNFSRVPPDQLSRFRDEHGVPTDYSASDHLVATAAAKRILILPVVIIAPGWAALYPGHNSSPPSDYGAYARYTADLVRRYGPRGSFWREHPALPVEPIRHWQIWNEPSFNQFWSDRPWAPEYVKLLKRAHRAIKAADPGAKTVLAGLPNQSWGSLNLIYKAGGRGAFDIAAFHPFTDTVAGVRTILQNDRRVMAAHGDGHKPLFVTELSWTAAKGKTTITYGNEQTATGQARRLTAAFSMLVNQRRRLLVQRVYWYTWLSYDRERFYPFDWAGLSRLKQNKVKAKPALKAFRRTALRLEGCRTKRRRADRCAS
ncbi:MAG: polysaccharide biosynthesis protein PslG [Thermoleophilaceae bacterium]|nr:polysaccharide biosynthesis protein PslG [Thermoleophilaceae bacterium]